MIIVKHTYKWANSLKARSATTRIVLHCAATPEGRDYSVDAIHRIHLGRKFSGIGYNFVIYRDGSIHEGRPEWAAGAHTTGYNSTSIGICYIGGMDADNKHAKDTRTPAQKEALLQLVHELMAKYKVPLSRVCGHYQFANKACPSFKMDAFRAEYQAKYGK